MKKKSVKPGEDLLLEVQPLGSFLGGCRGCHEREKKKRKKKKEKKWTKKKKTCDVLIKLKKPLFLNCKTIKPNSFVLDNW